MGEEKKVPDIPYLAFESSQARMERINKRLWIIILVLIAALVGSNVAWINYENQFVDTVTTTQTVEQETEDGGTNYVGDFVGGDYNGEAESN